MRRRLDRELVERGLCRSREEARRLVLAGEVRVGDAVAGKPSDPVGEGVEIRVVSRAGEFVSRGGSKLEGALEALHPTIAGAVAADVGASTGGFTDCLLRRGAARVYAIDVGYGQLAWSLRGDPRVVVLERQNIRTLPPGAVPEPVDLAVVDVSFISLRLVLPCVLRLLRGGGEIVALVKPQFEVGKGRVGKGGVVRDPALHEEVLASVGEAARRLGLEDLGVVASPLPGPKGNREFFRHWHWPGGEFSEAPVHDTLDPDDR